MIKKRSVTLDGHQTSITLEDDFWTALHDIAQHEGQTVTKLISNIDRKRTGQDIGLSSAIRLFVLSFYRQKEKGQT